MGRGFAALGFVVCLEAMTCACASGRTPVGVSVPPQPTQPPDIPAPVIPRPDLPSLPPPPPAAVPLPQTGSVDCAVIEQGGAPVAAVALGDRVTPANAPRAANESERLLFRQLYETLIRVDCAGRARPGLAATWRLDTGRTWIVTLRENARFSDGTPVTPNDVRASWSDDGDGADLRPDVRRLVESTVALDDRSLAITLRSQRSDLPLALAHPDLAVARRTADSPWPLGTRTDGTAAEPAASMVKSRSDITLRRNSASSVRFLMAPGDPRDLLDSGIDLVLTRDPATLDYAATLPQFQTVPLEWQRVYVLLTPGRSSAAPSLSEHARQVLAADAVQGEARGATGPFWWQRLQECDAERPEPPRFTSAPRIVYDSTDSVARDIAERLVGLGRSSDPAATAILDVLLPDRARRTYERAVGLTGEPLARARRVGRDAGYIVSLERRSLDPCRDIRVLTDDTRWVDPETIVPLVETRLRAIVRRGRSGVSAEWDGGLLIGASGPE